MQPRLGIRLADLTAPQLEIAKNLIREISGNTTNEGYQEFEQLLLADQYLAANGGGTDYGAGLYYLCFNGTPSLTGLFSVKMGGHHLQIENTYNNGVLVGATPHFKAIEPLTFTSGSSYAPMEQEKSAFVNMLTGLTATELTTARLASTFSDILLGAKNNGTAKDWLFPATRSGLRVGGLSAAQKTLVMNAIKTYVLDVDSINSNAIIAQYQAQLDETYIAYSGTTALATINDYVRIDGPSVWIEFSVQRGIVLSGVHYHSIWRDRQRDYGGAGSTAGVQNSPVSTKNVTQIEGKIKMFPNPFQSAIQIEWTIKESTNVHIEIFDVAGRKLADLFDEKNVAPATYQTPFDGSGLPKGFYNVIFTYSDDRKQGIVNRKMIKF